MDTTNSFSDLTIENIEAQLITGGLRLMALREAQEAAAEADRVAYAKYKADNAAVIETAVQAKSVKEQAEANLRLLEVELYQRTGDKKFQEAYQISLIPTPQYDPRAVVDWLLDAPRRLAETYLMLDVREFDAWLKVNANEKGAAPDLDYCASLPAVVINKPQASILSAGLPKLAAMVADGKTEPTEPVTVKSEGHDKPYAPSTDEVQAAVASTSAFVATTVKGQFATVTEPVNLSEIPF